MPYLPGTRFGRLTVIERAPDWVSPNNPKAKHKLVYKCKCDCGNIVNVMATHLASGHTLSCGCLNKELSDKRTSIGLRFIHGFSEHPIYISYKHMIDRCYNPNDSDYINYGARGIKICDEWYNPNNRNDVDKFREFFNWSMINGWKEGLSIDQINVDGNYEPSNCRWINIYGQANNKRDTRYVEYDGEMYPLSTLAYLLGVNPHDFYNWLYYRNFDIGYYLRDINTPYGPRRVLVDRNGNIVPINALWFVSKTGEYIAQQDYTDPEPTPALYYTDSRGFITGPMV